MDKETLSNYGWIVICVMVLAVMLAFASPFGQFVAQAVQSTTQGLFDVNQNALDSAGIEIMQQEFEEMLNGTAQPQQNEYGFYFNQPYSAMDGESEISFVFFEDTSFSMYENGKSVGGFGAGAISYGSYSIDMTLLDLGVGNVSEDGKQIELANIGITLELGSNYTINTNLAQGDYIYIFDDELDGYRVMVKDNTKATYQSIPAEVDGVPVVSLEQTFSGCKNLTTAPAIPNTIKSMYYTFYGCTSLTDISNITIPNGVTTVHSAFYGCTSLVDASHIVFPESLTSIAWMFNGCTSLEKAPVISPYVKDMWSTFTNCSSLETVDMSKATGVTEMNYTFRGCTSMTTAPDLSNCVSLKKAYGTFMECTSLTNAGMPTLPNGVEDLSYLFDECTSLTDVNNFVIPNSVTSMYGTFFNCTSLTNVSNLNIPNSVECMRWTFYGCTGIETAPIIPSGVKNMEGTFRGCTALTGTVYVNATDITNNTTSTSDNGHCFNCFYGTTKSITLIGTGANDNVLELLKQTTYNGNVTYTPAS